MPADALALALSAAILHAVWNLLLAGARDSQAATAVALIACALTGAVAAPFDWDADASVWPYVFASVVLELSYFALLGAAYHRAALSVVYPLARGLAPVLVLVGTVAFTAARTSAPQVVGVCLVAGGLLLVRGLRRADATGAGFGLAIACCIAAYTVVDKHGVAHASPVAYNALVTAPIALVYAPSMALLRGRAALRSELHPRIVVAGIFTFAAYALVLAALRLAPAASVAAVRETSVLIATALAAFVLRERVTVWRLGGAALVVGGVALISA